MLKKFGWGSFKNLVLTQNDLKVSRDQTRRIKHRNWAGP